MININIYIDPGVNATGLVAIADDLCLISKTLVTKKTDKPNQAVRMADNVIKELERIIPLVSPMGDHIIRLVYEEPNLSGRFLSRSQRTMDTYIGALQGLLYQRFDCKSFTPVHPMTLKSFYKAARTDKLDMALKAGQFLPLNAQEALTEAIENEEFDVTDAFALAARDYAIKKGLVYEEIIE